MPLIESLKYQAQNQPETSALVHEENAISFKFLYHETILLSIYLKSKHKIRPGDRVAYMGLNCPQMLSLFFACAKLGAIFTPFNSRLARDEYKYLLENAEPTVCFYDSNFADLTTQLSYEHFEPIEQINKLDGLVGIPIEENEFDIQPQTPLLLVYTSGTTGRPKGVVLNHLAVETNIANCHHLYDFKPGQNIQVTLPLFHVGGLCILLLPALLNGSTIYLHSKFDPKKSLEEIETAKIRTSIFVPAQMDAMMSLSDWETRDLSSMSHATVGSSIIPLWQIRKFHERNIPVSQVYGATETGPAAIAQPVHEAMMAEGSAGKAVKHCQVEVRSPNHKILSVGQRGEIWVMGDNILSQYWKAPDETSKVLIDGWYNTGDIGYVDENHNYWIVDRSKDVIISGGENIYPAEVEAAIVQHPAVSVVSVVGKADTHWGETPVAALELYEDQSLTMKELTEFLDNRLARYKQPKQLIVLDALPRNVMGKIEKAELRKIVAAK